MFRKVLVANRGEIARRVIRAARELGYRTVAVHSSADRHALHLREADEAVCIGEAAPESTYLNVVALMEAARLTGAEAVHPGYGFLAESARFARACEDAGLVFIGPSSRAIAAMGDKAEAKRLMEEVGVPCVPGYDGRDQDLRALAREAERIGFPVMIKARAGGGGRGMRLASSAEEFPPLLKGAQHEARIAFGDDAVILERAIAGPRHVEIQVLADRHGNVIHLGERECSVQRRHQKVIEEAPSPAVSRELRERMGATAVAAARAIGYEGAGTLEFLLDRDGRYYFMEMNTRLQVEHPVTEAVTGLDLVQLQLRIASGQPLPIVQDEVRICGHAIEARLCAEDPGRRFTPQGGTMRLWQMPEHGPGRLRVEHALESGSEIPPFYDSMIAKLISHGADREEARRKLARGLESAVALGVATNQAFLGSCLAHPEFVEGRATTAFVEENEAQLTRRDDRIDARAIAVASLLLAHPPSGSRPPRGDRALGRSTPITLHVGTAGAIRRVILTPRSAKRWQVDAGDMRCDAELLQVERHRVRFACDEVSEMAAFVLEGGHLLLSLRGHSYAFHDASRAGRDRQSSADESDGKLRATMTGRVVEVLISAGDRVVAGQSLVSLEAMKMECAQLAPMSGRVTAVHVSVGDQVVAARVLAEIEAYDG